MAQAPAVELSNVSKHFQDVTAVEGVSLQIADGEFFSLLGPSGCGKTTILRMIAGFDYPSDGTIAIHNRAMGQTPPYQRPVNTVFQSYALFPHMTVAQNVAFGLEMKGGLSKGEIAERVQTALDMVQLGSYGIRRPRHLSGGQQQRVALARALVNQPEVLLLDEPLGALDEKLRKEMQLELKRLQARLGITFVFVTHDQEEALTMSDRIAVMHAGRVLQVGNPVAIYERPNCRFVADFIGETNFLDGQITTIHGNSSSAGSTGQITTATVTTSDGIRLKGFSETSLQPDSLVTLSIRPEKVTLTPLDDINWTRLDTSTPNTVTVRVEHVTYIGSDTRIDVRINSERMFSVWEPNTRSTLERTEYWEPGEEAMLTCPIENVLILER